MLVLYDTHTRVYPYRYDVQYSLQSPISVDGAKTVITEDLIELIKKYGIRRSLVVSNKIGVCYRSQICHRILDSKIAGNFGLPSQMFDFP